MSRRGIILVVAIASCSDDGRSDDGGPILQGQIAVLHHTEAGVDPRFADLSATTISLLCSDGVSGPVVERSVLGTSQGSFSIQGCSGADHYLKFDPDPIPGGAATYTVVSDAFPDLSFGVVGRPDVRRASSAFESALSLDISNLRAWADGDHLELFSLGTGLLILWDGLWTNLPGISATSANDVTYPWWISGFPLIDTAMGDEPLLYQLVASDAQTWSLERAAWLADVVMTDGQMTHVVVALEPPATRRVVSISWSISEFAALLPSCHPLAAMTAYRLTIGVVPPESPVNPMAMTLYTTTRPGDQMSDEIVNADFGDPAPPNWQRVVRASAGFRVQISNPDGTVTHAPGGAIVCTFPLDVTAGSADTSPPLRSIGPPTINGANGFVSASGFGDRIEIGWSQGDEETREIYILDRVANRQVATIRADATRQRIEIPDGLLERGHWYVGWLRSHTGASRWPRQPYWTDVPSCQIDTIVGLWSP